MCEDKNERRQLGQTNENKNDTNQKTQTPLHENFSISKTDEHKDQRTLDLLSQIVKKDK